MKLRDYKFIGQTDLRRLGDWADWEEDKFITWIQNKMNLGQHIHKRFMAIYEMILNEKQKEATEIQHEIQDERETIDPISSQLEKIPIDEMKHYVDYSDFSKNRGHMIRSLNIRNLGQLYSYVYVEKPRRPCKEAAKRWQAYIIEHYKDIISKWNEANTVMLLPQTINTDSTPIDNITTAIKDLIIILKDRQTDKKYYKALKNDPNITGDNAIAVLDLYYNKKKSLREIESEPGFTGAGVVKNKLIKAFLAGYRICGNLQINQTLIDMQRNIRNFYVYDNEEKLIAFYGKGNEEIFNDLGLDHVTILDDIRFIIPQGSKNTYTKLGESAISVLRESVVPLDKDTILARIERCDKMSKVKEDYDVTFIDNLLACSKIIEKTLDHDSGTNLYRIQSQYLLTNLEKMMRIIYDAKEPISKNEALDRFEELYHVRPTVNTSILTQKGFSYGATKWQYGAGLKPKETFIREYVQEKIIFYWSDLLNAYNGPKENERSIRTTITRHCFVDTKDANHFCLKESVEDYPQFTWSNPTREGLSNWILNQMKNALDGRDAITFEGLTKIIQEKAKGTEYERNLKQNIKFTIEQYSGFDQPFLYEDSLVRRNEPKFNKTDFQIIGRKGGKYPYYVQIRSIISNEIKKTDSGRISLVEAIEIINSNLDEPQGRNTILRALQNRHLGPIGVEVRNIDGTVFIIKTDSKIKAEPTYVVQEQAKEDTDNVPNLKVVDVDVPRSPITSRLKIDWGLLTQKLKNELRFYCRWMQRENVDYDVAINDFVSFLKGAHNENLNHKLPQSLFEYWFASTDALDRSRYVCDLSIFYEALFREIRYSTDDTYVRKEGLIDWALDYPWTAMKVRYMKWAGEPKGFDRIFNDIHDKRNKFAHGESVELNSLETANAIVDYVALYIMTLAKCG